MENTKNRIYIILIIVTIILLNTVAIIYFSQNKKSKNQQTVYSNRAETSNLKKEIENNNNLIEDSSLKKDWRTWKHDILGVEFIYPEKWGEPITEPTNYITDLSTVNDKYKESDNHYKNAVIIEFEHKGPVIEIYNNDYLGVKYPNAQTYYLGAIDNFQELTSTANICDYKIEFKNNPTNTGTVYEKYSECNNNVKTTFFETEKHFSWGDAGTKFEYTANHYGFKKLQNNFFNNLLATFTIGHSGQIAEKIDYNNFLNLEFINKGTISSDDHNLNKDDFTKFINSIKSYKPKPLPLNEFKIIKNEDPNITTIRKYYHNIASGNLQEAYDMYIKKKVSYDEYESWYKNTAMASPSSFQKLGDNKYQFIVDLEDHNTKPTNYRIVMQVKNKKLETLSSEEITSEDVIYENMNAFTKNRLGYNYVILNKNNEEVVIEKASDNYGQNLEEVKTYDKLKFSPNGNYLTYLSSGWEWSHGYVYKINKEEIVLKLPSMYQYGFSNNEKYFYACGGDDMTGNHKANIYSTQDFQLNTDIFEFLDTGTARNIDCEFNDIENKLTITLSCFWEKNDADCKTEKIVEYDFTAEALTIVQ